MRTPENRLSLSRWMWRSYFRIALIPLLLVELVIVFVYLGVASLTHTRNVETAREIAEASLRDGVARESTVISQKLSAVSQLTAFFARQSEVALRNAPPPDAPPRDWYGFSPEGAYHLKVVPTDRPAVFGSGFVPIGESQMRVVDQTVRLDPVMRDLQAANPMVIQLYINTKESINKIYPPFDVVAQFPAKMDIPTYNFYYEADASHNPSRGPTWTDAYLDPAGAGWIVSSIAPVYVDDKLEAVVGLDVTLKAIIEHVLNIATPYGGYGVLVDQAGIAIALPPAAEEDWGLKELGRHEYEERVKKDTLKPEEFSLYKQAALAPLAAAVKDKPAGMERVVLGDGRFAAWSTVPETGWTLLIVVPEAAVHGPADRLQERSLLVGATMIGGMVLFYAAFFVLLAWRARVESANLTSPLLAIDQMVRAIGNGQYRHSPPDGTVQELFESGVQIARMGERMGEQVDALVRSEAEIRRARDVAEAASRARTQFLANMSHEIRTPMNGVLGMTELLLSTELTSDQARYAGYVKSSAKSLLEIINDLLDLSRIDAGRFELQEEVFDLKALAEDIVGLLRPVADNKGLSLILAWELGATRWVKGDPLRLRQILTNLLGNALKFTRRGGATLRVGTADSGHLRFEVEDTGIGVPAERLSAIFDAFTQADGTVTREFGGTGLGLTISARLVSMMGGTIDLRSEVGKGSVFWFEVPLLKARPPKVEATGEVVPGSGPGLRILVAEDTPINKIYLLAILNRAGHEPFPTNDGEEAWEAWEGQAFDIAIFDIQMPRLDGLSLIRRIRAAEAQSGEHLPIIALTANAMPADRDACFEAGADRFLAKPFSGTDLTSLIDDLKQG